MTKKQFDVYEFSPDKYYIVTLKTNRPAEDKLKIFTKVSEQIRDKGFGGNIILIDGDTVTVEEAVEFLDTNDQLKFREKYEKLLDAVKWRHDSYKKDLDRGHDADGDPLEGSNLAVVRNLYNVTDAILASVKEDDNGKKETR